MKIVQFSIRRPVTVTMLFVAVSVFGLVSYDQLPLNLLPEISYPTLTIRTRYEAAAPAEIESLISRPIANAVSVVNNVVRVTSVSKPELSDVIIEFSWRTQMDFASLDVREQLDRVELPLDADKPILLRYDPSTDPIMRISVTGRANLAAIRYTCEEFIRPEIESLSGVAAVRVSGGLEEEIQVELDENRMAALGLSIRELTNRLAQENVNLTGGLLREGQSRYLVRTLNEFRDVDEIGEIVVAYRAGAPVRLKDVGDVFSGYKERQIITRVNGEESVEIAVFKAADANTVSVADSVRRELEVLDKEYTEKPEGLHFEVVFDQSEFIRQSIDEVLNTAVMGGILAVLVLFLFLRSVKSTLIISLAIPISIVVTFFLMYVFRVSMNIMSLSGLALGLGMLVDNSIVVLEAISRYRSLGYPVREAADRGASEVGQAVTASTLTTVCVFVPIVFVEGIAGQLFADQALTVTFSLLASLLVAIMLIPMLSSLGATRQTSQVPNDETVKSGERIVPFSLTRPYLWILDRALNHRFTAIALAVLLLLSSLVFLRQLGAELIPEISQGEFNVDFQLPPGTALEETADRLEQVEEVIAQDPDVELFYTIVGSGNQTGVSAVEEEEYIGQTLVQLRPGILHEQEDQVIERLRTRLQGFPAVEYRFSRPTLFSFKTPVEVVIQGYNLNALKFHAERLTERLEAVPGLRDVKASTEGGNPEVHIIFDRPKLANFGLNVSDAAQQLRNKIQGDLPTEFNEEDRKIDIRVRLREQDRRSLEDLRALRLNTSDGRAVYLTSVADVRLEEGPTEIRRIGPQRAAVISGNLSGIDLQTAVDEIQQMLNQFLLPRDFVAFISGQSEERAVAFASMQFALLLAVFLVYLVMACQFESLVQPFIIILAIPFAAIGVALALYLTNLVLNVVVLIGAVVLAGIVVNNSIVLIDYTNQLRRAGVSVSEALRNACAVRLRPILMTTTTTVLGLLPMAWDWGEGAELRVPLAVTIIGGLVTSTLLTLVIVPVLYCMVTKEKHHGDQ